MGSSEQENCVLNQRTNRRVSLLIFLATLCLFGATLTAEQKVHDIDFKATESEPNIVKRTTVLSDDEDIYLGDPTSTPVLTEDEIGGTSETPAVSHEQWTPTATSTDYPGKCYCPPHVGRYPDKLPRGGNNWTNLLINNVFPCDGNIVGWEYYRLIPEGSAYVGVWRQHVVDSHFNLIAKTELPSAPVGIREVDVSPIPVKKGDFIGIFYPRSTHENVIAQAQLADDTVSSNELYQNFHLEIYDEDIQTQNLINLEDHDYKTINATFSLRAVMDYEVGPNVAVVTRRQCGPEEFDCGDSCVSIDYRCDGQQDCNNNADEINCVPVITSPEPCLEGRFRCNDGTCIPRSLFCNGESNCPDGSDEFCGSCREDQFQCKNGQCISRVDVCNAFPECDDYSDELPTLCKNYNKDAFAVSTFPTVPPACPAGYIRCAEGTCLESCEGPMTCSSDQFRCNEGLDCYPNTMKCDGMPDCPDGADEIGCGLYITGPGEALIGERVRLVCNVTDSFAAPRYIHWYKDGTVNISALSGITRSRIQIRNYKQRDYGHSISELYILESEISDSGVYTCAIEQQVSEGYTLIVVTKVFTCEENLYKCRGEERCIDQKRRCDGRHDCRDKSDEMECSCTVRQFQCRSGGCIDERRRCDNHPDCSDRSDETGCTNKTSCDQSSFTCGNGRCLDFYNVCDGNNDCGDNTDEVNCPDCPAGKFKCANSECIDSFLKCDGSDDCGDNSDEEECPGCRSNQFQCSNGACVSASAKCNRVRECADGSDELDCDCTKTEFRCANGQCIPLEDMCNKRPDCFDRSDESDCPIVCSDDEFKCANTECIDKRLVCDGSNDCGDNSDEQDCRGCLRNQFQCKDGSCVSVSARCNRVRECRDYSDEFDCECTPAEFRCANGQCISSEAVCDRRGDCFDRSDESDCPACRRNEFVCDDGKCFDRRYRCDRVKHCDDFTDEFNCTCNSNEFRCANGQCVPSSARCDRSPDCYDGSDEGDCLPTCRDDQFLCDNGDCIDARRKCDGRDDCRDNSDEKNCPRCPANKFQCDVRRCLDMRSVCNGRRECADGTDELNCQPPCRSGELSCDGQCFPSDRRCNGRLDCSDGSDEQGCGVTIYVSPQEMRKRYGTSASFVCTVVGDQPSRVVWIRRTGGAMPPQAVISTSRLLIPDLKIEDAGDYVCQAFGVFGKVEAHARLEVEFVGPPPAGNATGGPCTNQDVPCSNGRCVYKGYFCDGDDDCQDGSDERNCPTLPCEPNEFRCNNGRCAMKIWRCDGDNDCGDRSDELDCADQEPGSPCKAYEFQCASGSQCIPFGYQCDGENDCFDRSDEIGCTKPVIKTPPLPEITVEINGTFTIICEAIGVPTPLIVWRLNWGNIPTGSRVTVTSVNGYGNLTIRNAVPEDAGAYTCEAINNRGSIFAIPDANIIVRRTFGVCRASTFNADAVSENQCVKCFCFGQTQTCYSSNLQISQITLGNQVALVRRQNLEPAEPGFIQYIPTSSQFQVKEFNSFLRSGGYYWSLPTQFLNKRLSSYGGTLSYQVYYEVDGFENPTNDHDIILIGNGITLFHRADNYERLDKKFRPRVLTTVTIPLNESAWERSQVSSRGGQISQYATRDDLMLLLENVTHILIRASYDNRQSLIRLGNVLLTSGALHDSGFGRAVYVEECRCPAGYAGYSCEECAPGFHRVADGEYGRRCVACRCNQHSNECDPLTGICRNCRDNTAGPSCNLCADGYYGDPRVGSCQPCPCPLTTSLNHDAGKSSGAGKSCGAGKSSGAGKSCGAGKSSGAGLIIYYWHWNLFNFKDREVTCNCPAGYTGRRCERCASGYVGNPQIPGERCSKRTEYVCDTRGSISRVPDPLTGQCSCKPTVTGQLCDTCKPETFYLSDANPGGCIPCFCMGVTQTCQSTTWHRVPITLGFTQSSSDVILTDLTQVEKISEGFVVDRQSRELVFRDFDNYNGKLLYWSLPQQFLGNKVTAYGGNLRFTLRYRAGQDNTPVDYREPLVTIRGSDIDLEYRARAQVPERRSESFSVPFIESEWYTIDGNRVKRENFLMALAKLQHIFIRATFTTETDESAISGISLDVAEDRVTSRDRAYQVEQCACPRGYKGLSCEDCDSGYTRTGSGLYLGLCEECRCNRHSSECDPETGVCKNCRHNTEGAKCERCARGYYGDATRGSVTDCQKCPCPLTESPNQFSSDCILSRDGEVTCTACPAGHTGRRCERCAPGYQGNPMRPGDYCKPINVSCVCDGRGTVPNTVCDPDTKQCQCKNNVQGVRCSSCRPGYFNLNRDLETGCMKCFCMGITNVCTSSNYYRDEIVPMFDSDGSHNFALVNARLSRTITDGFSVNAERNEITFDVFEGIQREQDSLYFNLPPKFRGDKVSSYGGFLRFSLQYTASSSLGRDYTDLDVVLIGKQNQKLYYIFRPSLRARQSNRYDIPLVESSFLDSQDSQVPSRETFLTVLADLSAILIRATYHQSMQSVTLRDLRMDIAVPTVGRVGAPEVERCTCPDGYSGLSCQSCAPGFVRVEDPRTALGRCTRCNCNGHSNSCDPNTGVCQSCQHNTEGDRCERCSRGYYGDPSAGTPNDCRPCACPLTLPSNNFSPTCYLDTADNRVTCDRCPGGYTGRDCGQCAPGYSGNPRQPGGVCSRAEV
ncbi:Basement membrane-specific heparan sulfate proteoglycan core protein, partial [Bulinus truncatus]